MLDYSNKIRRKKNALKQSFFEHKITNQTQLYVSFLCLSFIRNVF